MTEVKTNRRGRPKSKDVVVNSNYMTVRELSKLLKISTSHIYTMTSKKSIPHIKLLGKKVLFEKDEIVKWLKSKKVSAE